MATIKNVTPVKTDVTKATTVNNVTAKATTADAKKAPEAKATEGKASEAKKPAAKTTTTAKKAAATKAAKKAELKSSLNVQFDGKSYTEEDLVKIAKDVWKFDLKKKVSDLASVELYIKPEEGLAYYVMNKEFTGSFRV